MAYNLHNLFYLSEEPLEDTEEGRELHYDELYPGHIPTTLFQKVLLSAGSAAMSLYDPARDGKVNICRVDICKKIAKSCRRQIISSSQLDP